MTDTEAITLAAFVKAIADARDKITLGPTESQGVLMRDHCSAEDAESAVLVSLGTLLQVSKKAVDPMTFVRPIEAMATVLGAHHRDAATRKVPVWEVLHTLADAFEKEADFNRRMRANPGETLIELLDRLKTKAESGGGNDDNNGSSNSNGRN